MYSELTSTIVSSLTEVGTSMTGVIGEVAPTGMKVMGAYLVIRCAVKLFKGVAKA